VGTTFVVDPNNGDDAKATGSGTAGGATDPSCAFKTVTAAIAAVNAKGTASPTTIEILGTSTVGPGETFPLPVPGNTTVTTSGGLVNVHVPAGKVGFSLTHKASTIDGAASGLVIDGGGQPLGASPQVGVAVSGGTDLTDVLTNVTIQGFANEGVTVTGSSGSPGGLTIPGGVKITGCGQAISPNNSFGIFALRIGDGTATVAIDVAANAAPLLVEGNKGGGIVTAGATTTTIKGVPGTTVGTGSVLVAQNGGPGLLVATNTASSGFGTVDVDGGVFYQNGLTSGLNPSSGIRVNVGTHFTLANSVSLANGAHGVHVLSNPGGPSLAKPLDFIDLGGGSASSPGLNVLQDGTNKNNLVGICLDLLNGGYSSQTLDAKNDVFGAAKDCSMTNATLVNGTACAKNGDYGYVGSPSNKTDYTQCQ
jgi:hypothetical protein